MEERSPPSAFIHKRARARARVNRQRSAVIAKGAPAESMPAWRVWYFPLTSICTPLGTAKRPLALMPPTQLGIRSTSELAAVTTQPRGGASVEAPRKHRSEKLPEGCSRGKGGSEREREKTSKRGDREMGGCRYIYIYIVVRFHPYPPSPRTSLPYHRREPLRRF